MSYLSAGNDKDMGDRGGEWRGHGSGESLYSKVARKAAMRHFMAGMRGVPEQGTVEHYIHGAMGRLGVSVSDTPMGYDCDSVAREDRVVAEGSDVIGGDIIAYTDGGLDPGSAPKAGWGELLMQGVWRGQYLRAWQGAQQMQGVHRVRHLRAWQAT